MENVNTAIQQQFRAEIDTLNDGKTVNRVAVIQNQMLGETLNSRTVKFLSGITLMQTQIPIEF